MDIDFHYDATFVAAVLSGYSVGDATTIAHAGQYIDDNDEGRLVDKSEMNGLEPMATALTTGQVMSHAAHSNDGLVARDRRMWTAFHFLPGNLDLHVPYQGKTYDMAGLSVEFRYDDLARDQFRSLCLPDSPLAIAMVNDTRQHHRHDLHLIGIRMHALIDTFAHMLYCGSAAWHVNDVDYTTEYQIPGTNDWRRFDIVPFNYSPGGIYYDSLSYTGHGRMGHIPDYPWVKYRYRPQWSAEAIVKDNPAMYMRAFEEMTWAMRCIHLDRPYTPNAFKLTGKLRDVVDGLIRKPHDRWDLFADWTDDRRRNWKAALQTLRDCVRDSEQAEPLEKLPHVGAYPVYAEDAWINAHRAARDKLRTDYFQFHAAARKHVAFVTRAVGDAGLSLLGAVPYAYRKAVQAFLDKPVRIKTPGQDTFWEVENSATAEGAPIQLWSGKREENVWVIRHAGSADGRDYFEIYNPKLDRYVTDRFAGMGDDLGRRERWRLQSCKRGFDPRMVNLAYPEFRRQVFPIALAPDGKVRFDIAEELAFCREDGNLGDSTKIVIHPAAWLNHPDWGLWEIVPA